MTVGVWGLAGGYPDEIDRADLTRQMTKVLHNATTRKPSIGDVDIMVDSLESYAALAQEWGRDFGSLREGGCDTWAIWPGQQSRAEDWLRYDDTDGMMRAWTMVISGLLTSYPYLHD